MNNTWLVLLPPAFVLLLAFITKQVLPSLLVGIIAAGFIVADFSPFKSISIIMSRFWEQVDAPTLYTFGFLILLGALMTLMNHTGGTSAYRALIKKKVHSKKSAETASIFLSLCFLIDDFFSTLAVGCIMRPLSDSFNIPRAKIAFLVDSLAAPMVILMPVSTWIAMLIMQLDKAGISTNSADKPLIYADPFDIYLHVIPYVFYSFIILSTVVLIVRARLSFGPMYEQELTARQTGNLFGGKEPLKTKIEDVGQGTGTITDFILPLGSLVLFVVLAGLYYGNFKGFGGTNTVSQAIQETDIFISLFVGSVLALALCFMYFIARKKLVVQEIPEIFNGSISIMKDSIAILFLAWTFSTLLKNDLQTGQYIAKIFVGSVNAALLPSMFFIVSLITSVSTGSSWGTIAVMLPLAVPMLTSFFQVSTPVLPFDIPMLFPLIGAIFSGAVAGDHVSPLGTTTIMSSTSTGCYHDDHVKTQLFYAAPALLFTTLAYVLSGILIAYTAWVNIGISLGVGILSTLATLLMTNYWYKIISRG